VVSQFGVVVARASPGVTLNPGTYDLVDGV
jgi:hypothetical protein